MTLVDQRLRMDFRSVRRRLAEAIRLFGNLPKSEYRVIVAEVVATLASQRVPEDEVYPLSLGAFPTLVKEALAALSASSPPHGRRSGIQSSPPETAPWEEDELDPVDAQWYFDPPSVERIISCFPANTRSVVALGSPTVAALAASEEREVTLVDITPRFFRYGPPPWAQGKKINFVSSNLDEKPYKGMGDADVVVMDPPWYIENYRAWLHSAVASCRKGGLIAVALPQLLTNRRSLPERKEIMEKLRDIGPVRINYGTLTYVTPSFELPVLAAQGLEFLHRWRRGDLALIEVQRKELSYPFPSGKSIEWRYRYIQDVVVRSWGEVPRKHSTNGASLPLIGPSDDRGYLLTGVGRNYLWSSNANLVTSRGRAATVREWGRLPDILDLLQRGLDFESAVLQALPGISALEYEPLIGILRTLLDR